MFDAQNDYSFDNATGGALATLEEGLVRPAPPWKLGVSLASMMLGALDL